jgi:hypothetical protein
MTRRWAAFLVLAGIWTWMIWPRFAVAIWQDDRSFVHGSPTSFLWVHAVLIGVSLAIGTAVGVLGVRAWRAASHLPAGSEDFTGARAQSPED